jgi:DNA polymerase III delta prime subunit
MLSHRHTPEKIENMFTHKRNIKLIDKILSEKGNSKIWIHGPIGIGKTLLINLLLKKYDFNVIHLNLDDVPNKKSLNEYIQDCLFRHNIKLLLSGKTLTKVVLIDNVEYVKRSVIKELIKRLKTQLHNFFIIFVSNDSCLKEKEKLQNHITFIQLCVPRKQNLEKVIDNVCNKENIIIQKKTKDLIIKKSQGDIRQLFNMLDCLKKTDSVILNEKYKKDNINSLVNKLFEKNGSFEKRINMCETDDDIIQLTIHENYPDLIGDNDTFLKDSNEIIDLLSLADTIKPYIHVDTQSNLYETYRIIGAMTTSLIINKRYKKVRLIKSYLVNNISITLINGKNISKFRNITPSISPTFLFIMRNIILFNMFNKDGDINKARDLIIEYKLDEKLINYFIKIDKIDTSYSKINITQIKQRLQYIYKLPVKL